MISVSEKAIDVAVYCVNWHSIPLHDCRFLNWVKEVKVGGGRVINWSYCDDVDFVF